MRKSESFFNHFSELEEVEIQDLGEEDVERHEDYGGDTLPFEKLGGRRFELLVYRLEVARKKHPEVTVTLVQESGDKGRDVIIYENRSLKKIIQCKNQREKMSLPKLMWEIGKISLYDYLDSSVFSDPPIEYEIWCTGGFFEPAANFIDTWPKGWTTNDVQEIINNLIGHYAALNGKMLKHMFWILFQIELNLRNCQILTLLF